MAQNVESTVNIKVTADTSDAQKRAEELRDRIKELVEESKQGNTVFADFSESIESLANGFSQLGQNTSQVSNSMEDISESSEDSSVNVEQLTGLLGSLAKGGQLNASTFEKLGSALGMSGGELVAFGAAAAALVATLKLLSDQAKEMANTFNKVAEGIGDAALGGVEWFVDSLNELSAVLDESIEKLQEFADMGVEIQNSYVTLGNFISEDAAINLGNYADSLERMIGLDATGIINDLSKFGGVLTDLGEYTDNIEGLSQSLYELALNVHGAYPGITSTEEAITSIRNALQTGKINKRNTVLYNLLGREDVENFNNLNSAVDKYNFLMEKTVSLHGAYQRYLETDAGKIEVLRQQYSSLMGNIGQIALHLYAIVAPVLTQILQLANGVLSAIMKIFNINVKTPGTGVGAGAGGGLGKIADDLNDVTKAAKGATKQVASFDDVIQISDSGSGGGGIADVGDLGGLGEFGGMLDDLIDDSNELVDIWAKFKELLESGDYFGAGKEFMQVIADQLRKIPWDEIQEKARNAGKSLAEFLNGVFDVSSLDGLLNWRMVGETVAEALNTIIAAVGSFLKEFDFNMMGKALGQAWDSLWDNLDIDGAAEALYEAFMGVFEFVNGWLEGGGLSRMAQGIADFIKSFFNNFDIEADTNTIVSAVTGVIDDIINAFYIVAEALTSEDVRKVVFTLIEKLVGAFKDNAGEWGTKIHDIVVDIIDFLSDAIDTADNAGLTGAISDFLNALNLGELLQKYLSLKAKIWWEGFKIKVLYNLEAIGGLIVNSVKLLFSLVIAILLQFAAWIAQGIAWLIGACVGLGERLANWLRELTANIGTAIGTFLGNIIGTIASFIINIWTALEGFGQSILTGLSSLGTSLWNSVLSIGESIGNVVGGAIESIKSLFSELWNFITGIFNPENWAKAAEAALDALWNAVKSIWNNTLGSISLDIPGVGGWEGIHIAVPKLATGGIVTGPTTALIGEAGAEAVLPLKNNTQWMDMLASKVANQINGGAGQSGGTIKLELTDKPFYTRAEMYEFGALVAQSLNAYGINIAVV